jgi:hypothetical protein
MKKYIIIYTLFISIICVAQVFGFRLDVEPVGGMAGESVTIPIKLVDIQQAIDIDAIGFTLIFDENQLTYVETQNANTLTKDFHLLAGKELQSGQVKVLGAKFDNPVRITKDCILMNIVFTIKNNISSPCTFSVSELLDDLHPDSHIQGDFNHDGYISLIDVMIALQKIAGVLPPQ